MNSLISIWQNIPSHLSPVAISIFGFDVRWYGLMYLVAFITTYLLVIHRTKTEKSFSKYSSDFILDLFTWLIIGLMLGARIGYVIFYNFQHFIKNPWEIILPFEKIGGEWIFTGIAGMSYHGGVIGVVIAGWIFLKIKKEGFWKLADLVCPAIPLGYTFGRLGNFLNGELWGRITDAKIGMYFERSKDALGEIALRHPSQLYEAFFEGIVLFVILWSIRKFVNKKMATGSMLGLYLVGYGLARFTIEYFREPDSALGFIVWSFSMGQVLSFGMIIAGVVLLGFLSYNSTANHKSKQ
ncbi:MAG: prolipoprotein diacylglyceryl transferase [Candidatus Peregrinibacteria bacterium]|nr:prolipoprotein diacylglyceryl transferase [Candidatus Peregrinibacteria bacterium]MDZ4228164.1 prolipoprotein diacylglyceryl transferase [Candidatus Levybacteria bacterium]